MLLVGISDRNPLGPDRSWPNRELLLPQILAAARALSKLAPKDQGLAQSATRALPKI